MNRTQDFITSLYGKDVSLFMRFPKEPKIEGDKPPLICKTLKTMESELDWAKNQGNACFFMPNISGKRSTLNADITETYAVWIDVDDGKIPPYLPLEPSAIVSRSDGKGHHLYWFTNKNTDLEKWHTAQVTLINFFKSDKTIKNLARLMRLPGTYNHKFKPPQRYELKKLENHRYTLDDIILTHQDQKHLKVAVNNKLKSLFGKEPLHDGEGRHERMVKAAFILNDYGFGGEVLLPELQKINKKYLADQYTDAQIEALRNVQDYATGAAGAKAIDDAMKLAMKNEHIEEELKDWYYIFKTNMFIDTTHPDRTRSREGFNAAFSPLTECVNATGYTFRHALVKTAEQLIYEPAKDLVINENGTYINMWKKATLEAQAGKPQWFINHVNYLFNEDDARHFMAYLAHMIQKPREKIMHALLIISPHTGTGKSIMVRLFKQLFGATNVVTPHNENIGDKYTGWARHYQLCFIHEIMQGDRKEFLNKIKPFITEETIEIREMYQPAYEIKNYMNIIASSNYRLPILVDENDRRWCVLGSEVEAKEDKYYKELIVNIDNKAGQVLKYLLDYDLKDFDPGRRPALTAAKQDIIDQSKSDLEVWIIDTIKLENPPFHRDLINLQDLYDNLPDRHRTGRTTLNRLQRVIQDQGGISLESRVTVEGVKKKYWAVRNAVKWKEHDAAGEIGGIIREWKNDDDDSAVFPVQ